MSSFVVIAIVCGIVWWVWSIAVRQLRHRQSNSADKPDVVEGLKAEEHAYNKGAGWAITGAHYWLIFWHRWVWWCHLRHYSGCNTWLDYWPFGCKGRTLTRKFRFCVIATFIDRSHMLGS